MHMELVTRGTCCFCAALVLHLHIDIIPTEKLTSRNLFAYPILSGVTSVLQSLMLWLGLSGLGSCHGPPHTDEFMLISVCLHMVLHVLLRTRGDSGAALQQNFNKIQDKTSSTAPIALYAQHTHTHTHTHSINPNTSQLVEESPGETGGPHMAS